MLLSRVHLAGGLKNLLSSYSLSSIKIESGYFFDSTSAHCAMFHVPQLPLNDNSTNFSTIQCDVVIKETHGLHTYLKDVENIKIVQLH